MFLNFIKVLLVWLFQPKLKTEENAIQSVPQPDVRVVAPVITSTAQKSYMTIAMVDLLSAIRLHEAGKAGYNADYRNDDHWTLKNYTFDQVKALARSQVTQGEKSSAIGGYQFLTKTLDSLKTSLRLKGSEQFTPEFQDDLAVALMIRRGYLDYMNNRITTEVFCNNLAMEWASLPVVTSIRGASRQLKTGQSYFAGDGLNKALHKPETVLTLVRNLKLGA